MYDDALPRRSFVLPHQLSINLRANKQKGSAFQKVKTRTRITHGSISGLNCLKTFNKVTWTAEIYIGKHDIMSVSIVDVIHLACGLHFVRNLLPEPFAVLTGVQAICYAFLYLTWQDRFRLSNNEDVVAIDVCHKGLDSFVRLAHSKTLGNRSKLRIIQKGFVILFPAGKLGPKHGTFTL